MYYVSERESAMMPTARVEGEVLCVPFDVQLAKDSGGLYKFREHRLDLTNPQPVPWELVQALAGWVRGG